MLMKSLKECIVIGRILLKLKSKLLNEAACCNSSLEAQWQVTSLLFLSPGGGVLMYFSVQGHAAKQGIVTAGNLHALEIVGEL